MVFGMCEVNALFTANDLQKMSQTNEINREDLVNIEEVQIDQSLPVAQRMEEYLSQIKNPYHFRCGDAIVHLQFEDDASDLKSRLFHYFQSLKKT
jgi:hypothetical protein